MLVLILHSFILSSIHSFLSDLHNLLSILPLPQFLITYEPNMNLKLKRMNRSWLLSHQISKQTLHRLVTDSLTSETEWEIKEVKKKRGGNWAGNERYIVCDHLIIIIIIFYLYYIAHLQKCPSALYIIYTIQKYIKLSIRQKLCPVVCNMYIHVHVHCSKQS